MDRRTEYISIDHLVHTDRTVVTRYYTAAGPAIMARLTPRRGVYDWKAWMKRGGVKDPVSTYSSEGVLKGYIVGYDENPFGGGSIEMTVKLIEPLSEITPREQKPEITPGEVNEFWQVAKSALKKKEVRIGA